MVPTILKCPENLHKNCATFHKCTVIQNFVLGCAKSIMDIYLRLNFTCSIFSSRELSISTRYCRSGTLYRNRTSGNITTVTHHKEYVGLHDCKFWQGNSNGSHSIFLDSAKMFDSTFFQLQWASLLFVIMSCTSKILTSS